MLVLVVKMATMLECVLPKISILLYSLETIFIKKYFLFTVGSVFRVKRFSLGGKCFADDEEVETEVRG
jgi:hypothetical protein